MTEISKMNFTNDVTFPVLAPNVKGLESALKVGAKEIAIFGAASESFSKKNINCSIAESLKRFEDVMVMAKKHNLKVSRKQAVILYLSLIHI